MKSFNETLTEMELDKKSPATIKTYEKVYNQYERFLEGETPTIDNAEDYVKTKSKCEASTININRMALRKFFNMNDVEIPKGKLKRIKENNIREDKFVTRKEVDILHKCANRLVDRVVIRTLFHTGVRATELTNIDVGDLDLKNERVSVKGLKGSHKIRRVRFIRPELIIPTLRAYLESRGIDPDNPTAQQKKEPLIMTERKQGIKYMGVLYTVSKLGKVINKPDLSPHWLRHGFVVWNKVHNIQPEICALQIGDTIKTTVEIYSHYTESDVDRVYDEIQGKISEDKTTNKNPIDEIDELKADNNNLRLEMEELKVQQKIVMKVLNKIESEK